MIRPDNDFDDGDELKIVTETVSSNNFKDEEYSYDPEDDRSVTLHVPVPVQIV
jgi:hypothetical protein